MLAKFRALIIAILALVVTPETIFADDSAKITALEALLKHYMDENAELKNAVAELAANKPMSDTDAVGGESKSSDGADSSVLSLEMYSSEDICKRAKLNKNEYGIVVKMAAQKFVDEARRRGLSCLDELEDVVTAAVTTTCADDPSKCSDKVLCPLTINLLGDSYIWSTQPAWIKYVLEAQKRGLDCPASANADRHENLAVWSCETNASDCTDNDLCELATYGTNTKVWKSGASQKFVDEARKRNLECGVAIASQAEPETITTGGSTCANDPTKCEDEVLCPLAVTQVGNSYVWSTQAAWAKHVQEAQERGLNCKVSETASQQETSVASTCETDPSACIDSDLCLLATYGANTKVWKSGLSQKFADEAKKRGLDCGVNVVAEGSTQAEPPKPQNNLVPPETFEGDYTTVDMQEFTDSLFFGAYHEGKTHEEYVFEMQGNPQVKLTNAFINSKSMVSGAAVIGIGNNEDIIFCVQNSKEARDVYLGIKNKFWDATVYGTFLTFSGNQLMLQDCKIVK